MSKKETAAGSAALVEAVCLRDCSFGLACEVVELTEEEVKSGKQEGSIDTHEDAIAYAKAK